MAEAKSINADEFKDFFRKLSQTEPEMKTALRKEMRKLAGPILNDVKQAEMAIPSKGNYGGTRRKQAGQLGLRASLVAATKVDFSGTGRGAVLKIRVSKSKFEQVSGRPRSIPWHMEGRLKRDWRHPIFGNREGKWVVQNPHPYLNKTVFKHEPQFMKAVADAVDEVLTKIESKSK
jgi:hypothetical protein